MELIQWDSHYYIRMSDIQETLGLNVQKFEQNIDQYLWSKKALEIKGHYISCKSACLFLSWYMDHSYNLLPDVANFRSALHKYTKKIPKRILSRSLRIEIAYRQQYACNICKLFPIPPTFEVDHINAIEDGGQDIATNLQALCTQCHKKKTRLNRLRKHKLFKEEASAQYDVLMKQNTQNTQKQNTQKQNTDTQNRFSKYFLKS